MINDNLIVEIIDVLKYKEKRNYGFTSGRDFAALSYRLNSDVSFTYNGKTGKATTDTICFFPKDITYSKTGIPDDLIVFHFYVYSDLFEDIQTFIFRSIKNMGRKKTRIQIQSNFIFLQNTF